MTQYNGWTNRETWLVNIHFMDSYEGEMLTADMIEHDVDMLVDAEKLNPFIADMLDTSLINYDELAETHNMDQDK